MPKSDTHMFDMSKEMMERLQSTELCLDVAPTYLDAPMELPPPTRAFSWQRQISFESEENVFMSDFAPVCGVNLGNGGAVVPRRSQSSEAIQDVVIDTNPAPVAFPCAADVPTSTSTPFADMQLPPLPANAEDPSFAAFDSEDETDAEESILQADSIGDFQDMSDLPAQTFVRAVIHEAMKFPTLEPEPAILKTRPLFGTVPVGLATFKPMTTETFLQASYMPLEDADDSKFTVPTVVEAEVQTPELVMPVKEHRNKEREKLAPYSEDQRQMVIERYQEKRKRRNWHKRTLYQCRKRFADKRPRVGGRFVKVDKDADEESRENESHGTKKRKLASQLVTPQSAIPLSDTMTASPDFAPYQRNMSSSVSTQLFPL